MNDTDSTQTVPASSHIGEPRARAVLTSSVDQQMVTFAYRWMPFGGTADDEILAEFGLTPVRFYLRVIEILEESAVPEVLHPSRNPFITYCRRRVREHGVTGRC
jgi:hypothetical protein